MVGVLVHCSFVVVTKPQRERERMKGGSVAISPGSNLLDIVRAILA